MNPEKRIQTMLRAFFLAMGICCLVLGLECLVVEKAELAESGVRSSSGSSFPRRPPRGRTPRMGALEPDVGRCGGHPLHLHHSEKDDRLVGLAVRSDRDPSSASAAPRPPVFGPVTGGCSIAMRRCGQTTDRSPDESTAGDRRSRAGRSPAAKARRRLPQRRKATSRRLILGARLASVQTSRRHPAQAIQPHHACNRQRRGTIQRCRQSTPRRRATQKRQTGSNSIAALAVSRVFMAKAEPEAAE